MFLNVIRAAGKLKKLVFSQGSRYVYILGLFHIDFPRQIKHNLHKISSNSTQSSRNIGSGLSNDRLTS